MHVLAAEPRLVVATGARTQGARPMAWQALFERSLGEEGVGLVYRGAPAPMLPRILTGGFDSEPTLEPHWAHSRLGEAMAQGPVIQAFRARQLPDDVARALVGVIVFEEDGLKLAGVRALAGEFGLT